MVSKFVVFLLQREIKLSFIFAAKTHRSTERMIEESRGKILQEMKWLDSNKYFSLERMMRDVAKLERFYRTLSRLFIRNCKHWKPTMLNGPWEFPHGRGVRPLLSPPKDIIHSFFCLPI